ncbi:MAG: hypothetical protein CFH40_01065 [Alphaproteobacteria bacterium MarineAlpha10_Bin3]|jgi:hypothetical protein|nr:MAG: hypothetical protein CFH40_01065 [Alphaproteobacteria bacterium MarineAlpha10_Bin3]PPR71927.1 MAG: hypothetical protein CFH09_01065 [Alphaproteobacteria bacterium MarineAlpha4_Bin1]
MFEFADDFESAINFVFLTVTALVAWHGISFRDKEGKTEFVHLLFGAIAAVFFFKVLFQDVLGVVSF